MLVTDTTMDADAIRAGGRSGYCRRVSGAGLPFHDINDQENLAIGYRAEGVGESTCWLQLGYPKAITQTLRPKSALAGNWKKHFTSNKSTAGVR